MRNSGRLFLNPMKQNIFFFIVLLLYSCNPQADTGKSLSKNKNILRMNFSEGDPSSLHPHLGIDLRSRAVETAIYEGLVRLNEDGNYSLSGAESIEISPSKTVYTFRLKPMCWSNGETVTAYQFERAWKSALAPKSACARSDLFYPIKNAEKAKKGIVDLDTVGIKALNSQTLIVELEKPAPYFLNLLMSPIFSPLYDESLEPKVFNGPFIISNWDRKKELQLIANPYYWDKEHVFLEKICISFIEDPQTALAMFEKGEIDWVGDPFSQLPIDSLQAFLKSEKLKSRAVSNIYWLHCNTESGPLQSTNIRKALSYAINRNDVVEHIFLGQSPTANPLPKSLSLLPLSTVPLSGDVKKAQDFFKKGLEELGLTQETFPTLTLSLSHLPGQKQFVQVLQQLWDDVLGIHVELKESDWNTFFSHLHRAVFQLGGCFKTAYFHDPFYHLALFKWKDTAYNPTKWTNPDFQNFLDLSENETDDSKRKALLQQAESILFDEMPVIPIYSQSYLFLLNNRIKNIFIDDLGRIDFKSISCD